MSYILEAVRKAEDERGSNRLGEDSVDQNKISSATERRRPWLAIAIFFNAIVFLLWLIFQIVSKPDFVVSNTSDDDNKEKSQSSTITVSKESPSFLAKSIKEPSVQAIQKSVDVKTPNSKNLNIQENKTHIDNSKSDTTRELEQSKSLKVDVGFDEDIAEENIEKTPSLAKVEPLPFELDNTIIEQEEIITESDTPKQIDNALLRDIAITEHPDVPSLGELPYSVQKKIPKLHISVHIYNPQKEARKVRVNGRLHMEGESVESDLFIEEITSFGVVFNHSGTLFKVNLH